MPPLLKSHFLLLLLAALQSCGSTEKQKTLFQLVENSGIKFVNTVENNQQFNIFSYRNFYNGGGVAIGDVNNDGFADVFFTANQASNKLYINKGNWQFEDISEKAGFKPSGKWGTGVVMVDLNSDGWLDIYVCNAGFQENIGQENELYINNKNGTFTEAAKEYGLADNGYTTHASFFDYDLDGDLDCYVLNNSFIPVNTLNFTNKRQLRAADWPVAGFLKGGGDKLLKNSNGKFEDVSAEAGIYGSLIGFGLGITVGDINRDHYPDIYVSNDFFEKDYLYINQKDGTFKEDIENCMQHISHSSMGADIGDINNDGYPDIFTTDMLPHDDYRLKTTTSFETVDINRVKVNSGFYNQFMQNTLQVNNRNGKFVETGHYSGVSASDWSWGGLIFDADNDGLSDLFVCNGIYHDVTDQDFIEFFANDVIQRMVMSGQKTNVDSIINRMPSNPIANRAFKNMGNLKFSDQAAPWGLAQPSFSNGAAYGDLDNDGDLDLVVNNVNQESFVYRNDSRRLNNNHFIAVQLKGNAPNTFAIGSKIEIYKKGETIIREVMPSRGFQSSVDYKIVVGLGKDSIVDSVKVVWPARRVSTVVLPLVNQLLTIDERSSSRLIETPDDQKANNTVFAMAENNFDKHQEDDFIDFYSERGVPMSLSAEGPKAATGDVNGDGLADVFIGAATDQPAQLYLQTRNGFFQKKKVEDFDRTASLEDVCAAFFDADGDKDLDLFVGTGGNNRPAFSWEYQNRLYINDGKGNFELENAFANTGMNTAVALAHDFDGDGDNDLFVGSRSIPLQYGATPKSFVYINDGRGNFSLLAKEKMGALENGGLITAAAFADITGDGKQELVVTGEWMYPKIFSFTEGKFEEIKTNLMDMFGWWKSVAVADLDNDGDDDLVLGNIGENFYLHPSANEPVKMWIHDFDGNGSAEKILTQTIDGKDKPVFQKRELVEQIASLRKQNLQYAEFASRSIQQLFPSSTISKSVKHTFNYPSSCIAYNDGNGRFTISTLPLWVQLSSVNAIECADVNGDGKTDLLLAGNQFGFLPQFSRVDGSYGHLLLNKGNRFFDYVQQTTSGINVRGQVNDIVSFTSKGNRNFLFLQNNDRPVLYQPRASLLPAKTRKN